MRRQGTHTHTKSQKSSAHGVEMWTEGANEAGLNVSKYRKSTADVSYVKILEERERVSVSIGHDGTKEHGKKNAHWWT